jgi:hypothetical protein
MKRTHTCEEASSYTIVCVCVVCVCVWWNCDVGVWCSWMWGAEVCCPDGQGDRSFYYYVFNIKSFQWGARWHLDSTEDLQGLQWWRFSAGVIRQRQIGLFGCHFFLLNSDWKYHPLAPHQEAFWQCSWTILLQSPLVGPPARARTSTIQHVTQHMWRSGKIKLRKWSRGHLGKTCSWDQVYWSCHQT